nr:peptidoglycan-binding protein [Pedobacter panaciterrae]
MENIADFFLRKIIVDGRYNSLKPIDDQALLVPEFLAKLNVCIGIYRQTYPSQSVTFSETYRSNALQAKYFDQGASKIKENGMHHYGIAADSIFIINGKRSYKGDVVLLRKIYVDNGLTILGMWDALHVQFIMVGKQQLLRSTVVNKLKTFQKEHGLSQTGLVDSKTIEKAREQF